MAKKAVKGKEVAKRKSSVPAKMGDLFEENRGGGFEEADKDSYAIPFLSILQSNSPQCKKSDGAYIKGAEEGQIFNTVTKERADIITVVPCYFSRSFIEWGDRDNGGGFIAQYSVDEGLDLLPSCEKDDKGKDVLPNGNILVDTRSHFVLVIKEDGAIEPAIISMSSTQMKKSKQWMSMMSRLQFEDRNGKFYTPPMFSHTYTLTTVPETNDKGSWMGWNIDIDKVVSSMEIVRAAQSFKEAVQKGDAKVDHSKSMEETEEDF